MRTSFDAPQSSKDVKVWMTTRVKNRLNRRRNHKGLVHSHPSSQSESFYVWKFFSPSSSDLLLQENMASRPAMQQWQNDVKSQELHLCSGQNRHWSRAVHRKLKWDQTELMSTEGWPSLNIQTLTQLMTWTPLDCSIDRRGWPSQSESTCALDVHMSVLPLQSCPRLLAVRSN